MCWRGWRRSRTSKGSIWRRPPPDTPTAVRDAASSLRMRAAMTADIRIPSEEDRAQVIDVLRTSLNFPGRGRRSAGRPRRSRTIDARTRATASSRPRPRTGFRQWFGGHDLATTGVYAVSTLPEHRGSGLESAVGAPGPARRPGRGASVSAGVPGRPSAVSLDRVRAGRNVQRASPGAAACDPIQPRDASARLELYSDRDRRWAADCYRSGRRHCGNGPVEPTDDDWLDATHPAPLRRDAIARAVVVRANDGSVEGSRRSATPTPKAVTWRSTSAWSA